MQLSLPKSQLPLFPPPASNPHSITTKSLAKITIKTFPQLPLLKSPSCLPTNGSLSTLPLQDKLDEESGKEEDKEISESILTVRRPVKEPWEIAVGSLVESNRRSGLGDNEPASFPLKVDRGLSEFAKKIPIFEPEGVGAGEAPDKIPLGINLELALYRAKVLARKFELKEADKILRKCILLWPEDGRAYVAFGKLLSKQSKFVEARSVYERGCQATQGENPYIWQCWAILENKVGNVRRARELFDAATVADKKHVAAWHGWAVLEIKQGNIKKARNLLGKGLKYCGGNEYIYQTLALLEAKGNRFDQARYFFQQATSCNPKSCASWIAWAQLEMQQEKNYLARKLFEAEYETEKFGSLMPFFFSIKTSIQAVQPDGNIPGCADKAVQASPKNRFAWHIWALFEASQGDIHKGRKLLKIGHALNPRDPVLLQSLALLEYKNSSANLARMLFRRVSELDPRHQPVWVAWGWMEWKEGNISTARELYRRALSINSTSESAARCLQAWGVLEQRLGNLSAARRLFRSSLNINSQSYITWMTWASLEEDQGNPIRAEEIRNLYFQQRTEVVDDSSSALGFLDIFDPALDSIKRLLKLDQIPDEKSQGFPRRMEEAIINNSEASSSPSSHTPADTNSNGSIDDIDIPASDFDVDAYVEDKLHLDTSKLDVLSDSYEPRIPKAPRKKIWKSNRKALIARP